MNQTWFIIAIIAVTASVTILLRAFPFLLFSSSRKCPPLIDYIGKVLAPAAIAMLVVYCLVSVYREQSFSDGGYGIAEFLGCATVILLHLWKKNPLLSIIGGTVIYMLMVQKFF